MIRVYLLVIVIILSFLLLRRFLKTPPVIIAEHIKKSAMVLLTVLVIILAMLGKLNWLLALAGVLLASVVRIFPVLVRYAPHLQRLWILFSSARNKSSYEQYQDTASGKMSRAQAYDILGLKPGATEQDIIQAHRKLMQKVHPDRGGTDYLAAQINQAKKILLHS